MTAAEIEREVEFEIPPAPEVDPTALATPTSVLVSDAAPRSEAWFRQRRAGITATDVVKVMHPNQWDNAITVWAEKLSFRPERDAGEAAWWGTEHEPNIVKRWLLLHPESRPIEIGTLAYVGNPRHLASLDRLLLSCPDGDSGACPLECKSRSEWKSGDWRKDVPNEEYVQVQWQMHVSGYDHAHVACLLGGNRMQTFRVDRDEPDIERFVHEADVLWQQVETGERPYVDPSADLLATLRGLYPSREGQVVLPGDEVRELAARYAAAKDVSSTANKVAKRAKDDLDAATAALVVLLDGAEEATAVFAEGDDPMPAFAFREITRKGYTVKPSSYRTIRVDPAYLPGSAPVPLNPAGLPADEPSVSFSQEVSA